MRHINIAPLLLEVFSDAHGQRTSKRLERAHVKVVKLLDPIVRKKYIDDNGGGKWRPIKDGLTKRLGNKCWYTEVELLGASLVIDHYRPVIHYWWLAFDAENYRVACPWANSPRHNASHGCAGGKGDKFPLLLPTQRATNRSNLSAEHPVILDPCRAEDCALLVFQADGRPILNPEFAGDTVAKRRVDESKLLLNLDHPEFNSKREQLCNAMAHDVRIHEDLPENSSLRTTIKTRIVARLAIDAPFSTAARFYLQLHRHLDWVDDILRPPKHQ